ncbi:MAG: hypothetical protein MUF87_00695 [Anaerolineae bacterium]|jgi:hypothetical protein|nr:hypothetical protein [Anaerolineae bacterium]
MSLPDLKDTYPTPEPTDTDQEKELIPLTDEGNRVQSETDNINPPDQAEIGEDGDSFEDEDYVRYRGATNDPLFGYLIAIALSIGLSPLIRPINAEVATFLREVETQLGQQFWISAGGVELRYTLSWGVLAFFGVLAWLFGRSARVGQETPDAVIWGVSFGFILSAPLLAFGGNTLNAAVERLFGMMSPGTLLTYLLFVIPLAETLFFRGVLQESRAFWVVGLMGALWSVILFFPLMEWQTFPVVALMIALALVMMNLMYSYVRERNGLAASWVCQVVVNLVLVFLPSLSL